MATQVKTSPITMEEPAADVAVEVPRIVNRFVPSACAGLRSVVAVPTNASESAATAQERTHPLRASLERRLADGTFIDATVTVKVTDFYCCTS